MYALIGLCLTILATTASGDHVPPQVCQECKEFVRKLGDYLATDASLVMQGQILDSACQAQKDKADKEDAASLDALKGVLGNETVSLGEKIAILQEAAHKNTEAQSVRSSRLWACHEDNHLPLGLSASWRMIAPEINSEFFGRQAEVICQQIGECGKFSASDCMGDCACRIGKIADIFQTGSQQTAVNRFLEQMKPLARFIDLAIFGMPTCASAIKAKAEYVCGQI